MVGAPRSCSVTGPTSWYVLVVLGLPSERFSAERAVLLLIVFLNMSGIDNAGITTVSGQTDVLYSVSSSSHPTFTTPFTYASSCRSQWLQLQLDGIPRYSVSYYSTPDCGTFYDACQPSGRSTFSPGVYPEGYHIATITQFNLNSGLGLGQIWRGACCDE
jgi:hypothetical protein